MMYGESDDRLYRLCDENRAAISAVHTRVDQIANALQIVIGAPLDDTTALVEFRDERARLKLYDRQIRSVGEGLIAFTMRAAVAGIVASSVLWAGTLNPVEWLKRIF